MRSGSLSLHLFYLCFYFTFSSHFPSFFSLPLPFRLHKIGSIFLCGYFVPGHLVDIYCSSFAQTQCEEKLGKLSVNSFVCSNSKLCVACTYWADLTISVLTFLIVKPMNELEKIFFYRELFPILFGLLNLLYIKLFISLFGQFWIFTVSSDQHIYLHMLDPCLKGKKVNRFLSPNFFQHANLFIILLW